MQDQPALDDVGREPCAFSARDKAAINLWLMPYSDWTVAYVQAEGHEIVEVIPGPDLEEHPRLTLAPHDGIIDLAARWPDGTQFCAALSASLSGALCFAVQLIEDALGLHASGLDPAFSR